MPTRRDFDVFNHSPYSELSGPVIKPGTVSTRKEALLNAYKQDQEPQRTPIKLPLPSKSHISTKLPLKSCVLPASHNEESEGPERSAFGPTRRKTGGFATHACRSPTCKGSSHQTKDPSKAVLYTIASLGFMSKGDVTGTIDDELCTGSQSLLHTNTSGTLLQPRKKQCMLVARIADQLAEKNPELQRVLTRELAGGQELLDVPPNDTGESLSELIDKALDERDSYGAEWSDETPIYDCEGIIHNPQGQAGFLGEQTRFTTSPTGLSPGIRKTDPLKVFSMSQSIRDDYTPGGNASNSEPKRCEPRCVSAVVPRLPRSSSDTESYTMSHSRIDCPGTPKVRQPISEQYRRRNSIRNRSKYVFDLAKTRTISAPCASAEQMSPSDRGRCKSHLHKTQDKAASIEQNLRKYTKGEPKPGNEGPEIQHVNIHRLNGSMSSDRQSVHSEQRSETPKSWRWWRFVLIDKEPSGSQPPITDIGPADKQAPEGGMHVLANSGRDDKYEGEKELEREILRVLIRCEQPSKECSPPNIARRPEPGTPTVDLCAKKVEDGRVEDSVSNEVGKAKYRLSMTIEGHSDTKLKVDIRSTETA